MSAINRLNEIVDYIITQLRAIGGDDFNYSLNKSEQVVKGYVSLEQMETSPTICVVGAKQTGSRWTDASSVDIEIMVELISYVKTDKDSLEAALKLASDIEKTIHADKRFGDLVYEMITLHDCAAIEGNWGQILTQITASSSVEGL